jgi:hypothetical protein
MNLKNVEDKIKDSVIGRALLIDGVWYFTPESINSCAWGSVKDSVSSSALNSVNDSAELNSVSDSVYIRLKDPIREERK